MRQHLVGEDLQRAHDLGLRQRAEIDQQPDLGDADIATSGEGGQGITLPFQALKADGLTAGDEATTIRIVDTEAA